MGAPWTNPEIMAFAALAISLIALLRTFDFPDDGDDE